jgi:hypothetical protein
MNRYSLTLILAFSASLTLAQTREHLKDRVLGTITKEVISLPSLLNSRGGSAIWEENFEGAQNQSGIVQTNNGAWTVGGADGNVWKHGFSGTNGCWSENIPQPTFATVTNGYLIFDADSANCNNPSSNPPDFSATALTGSITSPTIDLSPYNDVLLEFSHAARWCCQSSPLFIAVSNNGGQTWSADIAVDAPVINVNQQATTFSLNLSAAIGGTADARIRFSWNAGTAYYWAIDDIRLVPPAENELILDYGYISHNSTGEEYGRIPVEQLDTEMLFGGSVRNFGSADQTNLELTIDVRNSSNTTIVTGMESLALLASPDTSVLELLLTSAALVPDLYTTTFDLISDSEEIDFSNNNITRRFEITEGLYSIDGIDVHANGETVLSALGTNSFENAEDGFMLLNYYDIRNTMNVPAVEIVLANGTVAGSSLIVALHDTLNIYADDVLSPIAQTEIYDITEDDISTGTIRVYFDSPVELQPNAYYVGVEMFGGSSDPDNPNTIRILDDITIPQPFYSTMIYIPGDQVYSNGNAAAIRLLGDVYIGMDEVSENSVFSVYPNPGNGDQLHLSYSADKSGLVNYRLLNSHGGEVLSATFMAASGNNIQFLDLNQLTSGIYLLHVDAPTDSFITKIVLTK